MRLPRFYVPPSARDRDLVRIDGTAARQIRLVLRLHCGDSVEVFTGDGWAATAIIEELERDGVAARVTEELADHRELSQLLTLAAAYLKGEKADWVVQKATELGAGRVLWFPAQRSIAVPPPARLAERLARWQRIATEAAEQCGRSRVPRVDAAPTAKQALEAIRPDHLLVLHEAATVPLRRRLPPSGRACALMVGPEGGFTSAELEEAQALGGLPVSLGARILRAETAALAALALTSEWLEQEPIGIC